MKRGKGAREGRDALDADAKSFHQSTCTIVAVCTLQNFEVKKKSMWISKCHVSGAKNNQKMMNSTSRVLEQQNFSSRIKILQSLCSECVAPS